MPKKIDLTNQRFGKLIALYPGPGIFSGCKKTTWICQCDCGNKVEVVTSSLRSGHTQSCGCLQREKAKEQMKLNRCKTELQLSGQTFNYIQALYPTTKRNNAHQVIWKCKCLYPGCGEEFELPSSEIPTRIACPKHKNLSKGEERIKQILVDNNINFIQEYSPKGCVNPSTNWPLRFDFYLPDYNLLIEFDGEQHFKEQNYFSSSLEEYQYRDKIKNDWAKINNIKLNRIPYYKLKELDLKMLLNIE